MFRPLDQVTYLPTIAEGEISHYACEDGFVVRAAYTPNEPTVLFVRFFLSRDPEDLRTQPCAQACYFGSLESTPSVWKRPDAIIETLYREFYPKEDS